MCHLVTMLTNNLTNNVTDSSYIKTIISVSIPAFISIIGFYVTTKTVNSNFKNEIAKQKTNVQIENMSTIPYDILLLLQRISEGTISETELSENFHVLMNKIYSYGSENAIIIISNMQNENYNNIFKSTENGMLRYAAYYILLATQIKYDVTEILINPSLWYKMKINDYASQKEIIKEQNNKIVTELNLSKKFLIK